MLICWSLLNARSKKLTVPGTVTTFLLVSGNRP